MRAQNARLHRAAPNREAVREALPGGGEARNAVVMASAYAGHQHPRARRKRRLFGIIKACAKRAERARIFAVGNIVPSWRRRQQRMAGVAWDIYHPIYSASGSGQRRPARRLALLASAFPARQA